MRKRKIGEIMNKRERSVLGKARMNERDREQGWKSLLEIARP